MTETIPPKKKGVSFTTEQKASLLFLLIEMILVAHHVINMKIIQGG